MLDGIYGLQRDLNNRLIGRDILSIEPEEERVAWLRRYLTAYEQELKELVESLDAGAVVGARGRGGELPVNNIRVEIIDMLHFLLSLFQTLGERTLPVGAAGEGDDAFGRYCEGVAREHEEREGFPLRPASGDGMNRLLLFLALRNLVGTGRLLDCMSWKWWARQEARWGEARRLLVEEIFPQWCAMVLASGMTPGEAQELYLRKHRLNVERQEKGYGRGAYAKVDGEGREDNERLFGEGDIKR